MEETRGKDDYEDFFDSLEVMEGKKEAIGLKRGTKVLVGMFLVGAVAILTSGAVNVVSEVNNVLWNSTNIAVLMLVSVLLIGVEDLKLLEEIRREIKRRP